MKDKTICVDFDGVLNTYQGWKGEDYLYYPREGAKEFIERLYDHGYTVVIHSTRNPVKIREWLKDHKFRGAEWMMITTQKVRAVAYVDDRAIPFRGNFTIAFELIREFVPYWDSRTTEVNSDLGR